MERITVNMRPTASLSTCHASQYDVGREIRFDLMDGTSAYTLTGAETITLKIRTPEGALIESNVPNTSDNYVVWTSSASELDFSGVVPCALEVTESGDVLGSANFIMEVEADAYDGKNLRIVTVGPSAICTFTPNLTEPLLSVKSAITPAQSGSGTPYPPGGGKNKLNYDEWKKVSISLGTAVWQNNGVTLTATGNDCCTYWSEADFGDAIVPVSEGETVILSWEETTNTSGNVVIFPNGQTAGLVAVNNSTYKSVSYTVASGITFITFRFGVANSGDTIAYKNIQINKGTRETTWTPYSNIRPLIGYTDLTLTACGVNLFNVANIPASGSTGGLNYTRTETGVSWNGTASSNGWKTILEFTFPKTGTYHFKADNVGTERLLRGYATVDNSSSYDFTVTDTSVTYRLALANTTSGESYTGNISNIIISVGSGETDYHAYNGTTHVIDLDGTRYGGTLDVTSGTLTDNNTMLDISELAWGGSNGVFNYTFNNIPASPAWTRAGDTWALCEQLKVESWQTIDLGTQSNNSIHGLFYDNKLILRVYASDYATASDFTTAISGCKMSYITATPVVVSLAGVNLFAIANQVNNVFADTGDTELKYLEEVT